MPDPQKAEPSLQSVPIGRIDFSPYQIRGAIDETRLHELATSMQQSGLAQPILVRPIADRFELVVGERRTRAAKLLGWESIPATRDFDEPLAPQPFSGLRRSVVQKVADFSFAPGVVGGAPI